MSEEGKKEIDKTICRWFEKTNKALDGPCQYDGEDLLIHGWCLATVALSLNYFESTLILLNNSRKLPAKALLRVLGELIAKIVWCLRGRNKNNEEMLKRFHSWYKSTLIEQRRIRKKGLEVNDYTEQQRTQIKKLIAKDSKAINGIKAPELPKIKKLFQDIFALEDSTVAHGGMYLQFLRAVHPDIIALENTMDLTKFKEGKIGCQGDTNDNIERLKLLCLAHAYILLLEIWEYYGIDTNSIKSDYEKFIKAKGF